jgi:hypothetical protein
VLFWLVCSVLIAVIFIGATIYGKKKEKAALRAWIGTLIKILIVVPLIFAGSCALGITGHIVQHEYMPVAKHLRYARITLRENVFTLKAGRSMA